MHRLCWWYFTLSCPCLISVIKIVLMLTYYPLPCQKLYRTPLSLNKGCSEWVDVVIYWLWKLTSTWVINAISIRGLWYIRIAHVCHLSTQSSVELWARRKVSWTESLLISFSFLDVLSNIFRTGRSDIHISV